MLQDVEIVINKKIIEKAKSQTLDTLKTLKTSSVGYGMSMYGPMKKRQTEQELEPIEVDKPMEVDKPVDEEDEFMNVAETTGLEREKPASVSKSRRIKRATSSSEVVTLWK